MRFAGTFRGDWLANFWLPMSFFHWLDSVCGFSGSETSKNRKKQKKPLPSKKTVTKNNRWSVKAYKCNYSVTGQFVYFFLLWVLIYLLIYLFFFQLFIIVNLLCHVLHIFTDDIWPIMVIFERLDGLFSLGNTEKMTNFLVQNSITALVRILSSFCL